MLTIIPTPIGNLDDITLRAIKALNEVDYILAEDTRQTAKLLNHLKISKQLVAYHKFNEHKATEKIINEIKAGRNIGLVSDAGTPAISDPGFLLVRACVQAKIKLECLPGATAFVPALVNSGLPSDRFCFEGFLPAKKGRQKRLSQLAEETRTLIFYESPHRLIKTLEQLKEHFGGEREACVSRELTKIYEENIRDSITGLITHYTAHPPKGEIVIVVKGNC
jgi:16S rRNA (cytidine1402-2'-O)-methyltransferase